MRIVKVTATVRPTEWQYNKPPEPQVMDLQVKVQGAHERILAVSYQFLETDLESRFQQIWRNIGEELTESLRQTADVTP